MKFEYFFSISFIFLSILLSFILFSLFFVLIFRKNDFEKLSAYECGFNPFDDNYGRFDVKFYLVAILFLIFDLEVTFIFPCISSIFFSQIFSILIVFFFFVILTIGFFYEWKRGALEW